MANWDNVYTLYKTWWLTQSYNWSGVGDEQRAIAHKVLSDGSDMTQEFVASGDKWTMTTTTAMGAKSQEFTLGQEFDSATLDGRPVKVHLQAQLYCFVSPSPFSTLKKLIICWT